jgi:hypothetical protein
MNAPRYARLAGRLFVNGRLSIPPSPPALEARTRAIAAVQRAIIARGHKRRLTGWTVAFVSVAAVAAAVAFVVKKDFLRYGPASSAAVATTDVQVVAHPTGAGARVVSSGTQTPLAEGGALRSGSRVLTSANGGVSLSFSTGTSAVLGAWGDMTLIGDGNAQVVRLDSGSVDLHVAKLAAGQRFLVDTPDAEVEVRGTRFRVSVVPADPGCGHGTWTRVAVTEGIVEVRHSGALARLVVGDQWPSDCGRTANLGAGGAVGQVAAARPPHDVAPPVPLGRSQRPQEMSAAVAESTLRAQNNLFAQAVAVKRAGDNEGAISILDRFLTKYPASPLTESVVVERMRLLRTTDPKRATAAATQYLVRYPNGFAHAEAATMVSEAE